MESKNHVFVNIYFSIENNEEQREKLQRDMLIAIKDTQDKNPNSVIYAGGYEGQTFLSLEKIKNAVENSLAFLAQEVDIYGI